MTTEPTKEQANQMEREDYVLAEKSSARCESRNPGGMNAGTQCDRPLGHANDGPGANHFGHNLANKFESWD
ncbi:MAG: hypothetical protein JWQ87_5421 [Candidatus Sulfotelmatobacter sp.]|nr:hypothetical protein [Candidatus Sulfotelmatobacter sp.]